MSEPVCYLNGEFLPLDQAKISVLDRGFIFGDAIYEVIPVYRRKPLRLAAHLARLNRSLAEIRIAAPFSGGEWAGIISDLIGYQASDDQAIYLQVSRGVAKREFGLLQGMEPTVFAVSNPFIPPPPQQIQNGIAAVSLPDFRWLRCDIKSTSLLGANMLRQFANDAGGAECVLFRDGHLTEGSSSNIFVVKNGVLITPPKSRLILPGITYDLLLELANANAVPTQMLEVLESEVKSADELMLSASLRELLAITQLDGKPIGDGVPGPIFKQLYQLFTDYKANL
jgi:D-alanine transaminase